MEPLGIRNIFMYCVSILNFIELTTSSPDLKLAGEVPYDIITTSPKDHQVQDEIEVTWENSTTSSIAISWQFAKNYKPNGTLYGTQVEYYLRQGKFRSHILKPSIRSFVFENLKVATTYHLCVTLFESVNEDYHSKKLEHTKCFRLPTIPYIRKDSVLILMLTLSYFLFMGLMGYSQWRRRIAVIRKRVRRACENSSEPTTPVLRWREVEERQRLCFPSSIEESPRIL